MEIRQVQLATRSLADTARFYERLGCSVEIVDTTVRIVVGSTLLVFRELPEMSGALHLAITIPTGTFDAAKAWIAGLTTVLGTADQDEFEGPPNWNSRSVYFEGPDQQLLELIERRDLESGARRVGDGTGTGTVVPFVSVSEVGVPVPDVLGAASALRRAGLEPYANPPGDSFAAVGDVDGLVILVSPDRRWFPTGDRSPSSAPVVIDVGLDAPVGLTEGVLLR
ncbi:VOC family protein [Curtobacterium flaccumfaciens]|jgi:catechol-2,3-dioxygenase|uniref:VOC family protein n=1 Tax=Curtobacterium flaccumfaciens TaxID=2035 RepID=UPI0038799F5C